MKNIFKSLKKKFSRKKKPQDPFSSLQVFSNPFYDGSENESSPNPLFADEEDRSFTSPAYQGGAQSREGNAFVNPLFESAQDTDDGETASEATTGETSTGNAIQKEIMEQAATPEGAASATQHLGASAIEQKAGLPTVKAFLMLAGYQSKNRKMSKNKHVATLLKKLTSYHKKLDNFEINAAHKETAAQASTTMWTALNDVILACRSFTDGIEASQSNSVYQALAPAVVQLSMQAYALMPLYSSLDKVLVDHALDTGNESFTIDSLLSSRNAQVFLGTMGHVNEQSEDSARDASAHVMQQYNSGEAKQDNMKALSGVDGDNTVQSSISSRHLPSLHDEKFGEELTRLLTLLDDSAGLSSEARTKAHSRNVKLMLMLQGALQNPDAITLARQMTGDAKPEDPAQQALLRASNQDGDNVALAKQLCRVSGKTVAEARDILLTTLLESSYDPLQSEKHIVKSGALSEAVLDISSGKVFRAEKGVAKKTTENSNEIAQSQENKHNAGYDVAVSKVDELLGFRSIARAKLASYTNATGDVMSGSQMELVGEKDAFSMNESEIFDPRTIHDLLRLQVVDYLVRHTDRHGENFRYNPNAAEGESTIKGIDNDMVFGQAPTGKEGQDVSADSTDSEFMMIERRELGGKRTHQNNFEHKSHDNLGHQDLRTSLRGFDIITPDIRDAIMGMDENALDTVLRPYVNRTARFGVIDRLRGLKEYITGAEIVNLWVDGKPNQKGIDAFHRKAKRDLISSALSVRTGSKAQIRKDEAGNATLKLELSMENRGTGGSVSMMLMQKFHEYVRIIMKAKDAKKIDKTKEQMNEEFCELFFEAGFTKDEIYDQLEAAFTDSTRKSFYEKLGVTAVNRRAELASGKSDKQVDKKEAAARARAKKEFMKIDMANWMIEGIC